MSAWVKEQRRAFIWKALARVGRINKRDLIAEFGISTPQCSVTFGDFLTAFPGAMAYDTRSKAYVVGDAFTEQVPQLPELTMDAAAHWQTRAENAEAELARLKRHMAEVSRKLAAILETDL